MNIRINSNFKFRITGIAYTCNEEISVTLISEESQTLDQCQYSTVVSDGSIETRRSVSLLEYARRHEQRTDIKPKTQLSYRLMCDLLEKYGDTNMDNVTTEYLQNFITHLQNKSLFTRYLLHHEK